MPSDTSSGSPRLGLGEEFIPSAEAEQIETMLAMLRTIQELRDRHERPVKRNLHPKQHACLRAELLVETNLPPAFKHGVFSEPRAFSAVMRLSNAKMRDDRLPDAHGMALKLFEVDGPRLLSDDNAGRTQDFVLVDHPVFFARDVADMVPLLAQYQELLLGGVFVKSRVGLRGMFSHDHRFRIMRAMVLKMPCHLLSTRFWTTTPIKLGPAAVKLSVRPASKIKSVGNILSRDKLRLRLASHLQYQPADFALLAQVQTDPLKTPIEDATVQWDERHSPPVRVATLRIFKQTFNAPEQIAFGENLSFTPWQGLAAHQPLGGINRARKSIYQAMAKQRRELNKVPPREPTLPEVEALWRGRL